MFLPAMRDFQAQATCRLAEAEDLFQDMKTRVSFDSNFRNFDCSRFILTQNYLL